MPLPPIKQLLRVGAGCAAALAVGASRPAGAIQYVFTGTTSGATFIDDSGPSFNGTISGSFNFTNPGGNNPTFTDISVTAVCFEGASGQSDPCDFFGPETGSRENTTTFTNVIFYDGTNTLTFNNNPTGNVDVLQITFSGGALTDSVGTRPLTGGFYCSASTPTSGPNAGQNCGGGEQAIFTSITGSLVAVPSPVSGLALLPVVGLGVLRRRYRRPTAARSPSKAR